MGDDGDVTFAVDLDTGVMNIGVRPKYGLESSRVTATVTILDFLDQAATLTLVTNDAHRRAMATLSHTGAAPVPT